jgi:hypothetical protein
MREDDWPRRATAAAIAAARRVVTADAAIPANTPIGRLSDVEWGWVACSIVFAWIATRAEQATAEGHDVECAIREGVDGAWGAGAIAAILPQLAETTDLDWSKPLAGWPREDMIRFLSTALALAQQAMAARDRGPGMTRPCDVPLAV